MLDDALLSDSQKLRVDALLDDLFDLPEAERLEALRQTGERDPAVIAEVASLLRASEAAGEFLCAPAGAAAGAAAVAPEIPDGERLGDWRITRLIGRGGMGDVYEAFRAQGDFEQRVAIKILQRENSVQLQRFQAERQILARLEHPGIARLIDGGVTGDGRPYMVMEFVAGSSITEFCKQAKSTLQERLHLFMQVCDAVAFAHRNLVVHRDIKPTNILVTAGRDVKLLDFGIAKLMDVQQAQSTLAAAAFMTPSCAAPEQLTGAPITTATDVYALGLLLFELLTGAHPWMQTNTPVLPALRIVFERPLPSASRTAQSRRDPPAPVAAAALRGDLDAIIAKALRSEPAHRFATVEGLKLDIGRVLRGEPVAARDGAHLYVFGRIVRRYRWAAAAIIAVIVSLAGGLGVAAFQAQRASTERDIARRDAAREEAVRYSLTSLFRASISESGAQPATAKTMIDGSAQRVLREYRDQPQLSGQIVLTLADLYTALEDVTGAAALLEGYIDEATPQADPAALADARQKLAGLEMMRGHADRAAQLLDQSDAYWKASTSGYAEERLEGLGLRARLQRTQGDFDGSIATSRQAIAARIALSGHDHRETAILYNSLAISLNAANRLDEALAAYAETNAIYRSLGLADGLDAQIILANTGVQALRAGKLGDAETLLKNAVAHERALAGDSAAVGAALGYYSKVLTVTDRAVAAVPVAREAVTVSDKYAGATSPVSLLNRLFLGEALMASGDLKGAGGTLLAAHEAAEKQYGASHTLSLRTQLAVAQLKIAEGDYAQSLATLQILLPLVRATGGPGSATLAQGLDALADVQIHEGDAAAAILSLEESVALREKLHYNTWELFEARERLGEILAARGDVGAPRLLKKSAQDLESQLGPSHPQTVRAKQALTRL